MKVKTISRFPILLVGLLLITSVVSANPDDKNNEKTKEKCKESLKGPAGSSQIEIVEEDDMWSGIRNALRGKPSKDISPKGSFSKSQNKGRTRLFPRETPEEKEKRLEKVRLQRIAERQKLTDEASQLLTSGDPLEREFIEDSLAFEYVSSIISGLPLKSGSISFITNYEGDSLTSEQIRRISNLTKFTLEKGYFIVHDGNSLAAPIIDAIAGPRSIAVGNAKMDTSSLSSYVVIRNSYLRLELFGKTKVVAVDPNSTLGLALIVHGKADQFFDDAKLWRENLYKWTPPFSEQKLGLFFGKTPTWLSLENKEVWTNESQFSTNDQLQGMTNYELRGVIEGARLFAEGQEQMQGMPGGAVVFGSSSIPSKYTRLIYNVSRRLAEMGMPIATGGAGGVMAIANMAAYDAGGDSIGIPITGRAMLAAEKDVSTSIHTETIASNGYSTRIPLLLQRRKLVVIAPGGKGTMKELATTLLLHSAGEANDQAIVFLGGDYYSNLLEGLLPTLPQEVVNRVFLVDSVEEMESLVDDLQTTLWKDTDRTELFSTETITPRNDRTSFPVPKKKKGKSGSFKLGLVYEE